MSFENSDISDLIKNQKYINARYGRYYQYLDKEFSRYRKSKNFKSKLMNVNFRLNGIKHDHIKINTSIHHVDNVDILNFKNKANSIVSCCNFSVWDFYEKNNLMDLKQIYRCKDNRFCPNCKKVDVSKFIFKVKNSLNDMLDKYDAYMLTLTIPNCDGSELEDSLSKLAASFRKLNHFFSSKNKKYHMFDFIGGFKVLEITYNKFNSTYHPHYHCLVLLNKNINFDLLEKKYKDRFSKKRNSYNYLSDFEVILKQVWSLIYYNFRLSKENLEFYRFEAGDDYIIDDMFYWLEIDFRPLDDKGILEIFKYTFKDIDVINFDVFKTLYFGLNRRRLRQGFGVLYNFKCEDLEDDIIDDILNYLEVDKIESPQELLVNSLKDLQKNYSLVKKISRYSSDLYDCDKLN